MQKKLWVGLVLVIFLALDNIYDLVRALPYIGDIIQNLRNHQPVPDFASEMVSLSQILLTLVALILLHRFGIKKALEEIGLSKKPFAPALIFTLMATLPLWLVFAVTMPVQMDISLNEVFYLSLLSPVAEEVVYRGFAFGQIRRRAGWGFWPSALLIGLVFGLGHLGINQNMEEAIGVFLITTIGGVIFSWIYEKWNYNLWAPIGIHFFMNLAWNIFDVGDSAFAGWLPTVMQISVLVMVIFLIKYKHRIAFFSIA
jgi:membrane protease YdiL (CAAX protease family)